MNKNEYLNCFMEHGVNGVWKSQFAESLLYDGVGNVLLCCNVSTLHFTSCREMEVVKLEEGELPALSPAGVTNVQLWS